MLLNKVESEAKAIGATTSHTDTFDWQAKDFYLKFGYEVFGVIEDCPKGHKRFFLKKRLLKAIKIEGVKMLNTKSNISTWFRSSKIREWWGVMIFAFFLFAGRSAIADWNRIPSGSMEPSIYIGDLVLVNKLAYDLKVPFTTIHLAEWNEPKRGEIVVFFKPQDNMRLIKRVIGTPGDVIEMKDNYLIINGQMTRYEGMSAPLNYKLPKDERELAVVATERLPERTHAVMGLPSQPALRSFGPIKVPAGKFLMLGDNRDSSGDSRYFGLVPRKQIVGRAERVLISWDSEAYYKPRFERFLQTLI